MNKRFCYPIICLAVSALSAQANEHSLMTLRDMLGNNKSNISLINGTNQAIAVSGLFIASFDVDDCSSCSGNILSGDNMGGALVSRVLFQPKQSVSIGQNYLYNMLYNGIYYIKTSIGSSPCSLPGCSWPGDITTIKGWCITINAVSKESAYTYSNYTNSVDPAAAIPAYGAAGNFSPFDYKFDLIDPSTLGAGSACLGPIKCDDKTLTCQVSAPQSETFLPY